MKNLLFLLCAITILGCRNQTVSPDIKVKEEKDLLKHPDWVTNAVIYEINTRQYTPEGTFKALKSKLPQIKDLGVKILWFMPVQPIGVKNRKGSLGSYYSIKDYTAVNPEFGTLEEFKHLIDTAHAMGFKVILDWVGNHSAWDNKWITEHPEWYTRDSKGNVVPPVEDWSDVADLNYENAEMRKAMLDAMKWWVVNTDIDGFRCDVAYMVPKEFWNKTRRVLDSIKPVFMLAEAEGPDFHDKAFDMTYGWELHHLMNKIARGEAPLDTLDAYVIKDDSLYSDNALRMYFTTNHDENSWNGTVHERLGENDKNFFVLCATLKSGIPLIYGGQEWGLNKSIAFFDKDTITGTDTLLYNFYKKIVKVKNEHPALKNGVEQGEILNLRTKDDSIYAFKRMKGSRQLFVVVNISGEDKTVDTRKWPLEGSWNDILDEPINKGALLVKAHDFRLIDITANTEAQ